MTVVRNAIAAEIKRLAGERARLEAVLKILGPDNAAGRAFRPEKVKRRLRLKNDVAADISSKVVKAVRAHRDGASRKDILTYLSRNGYDIGHHFNEPHLNKLVNALLGGDAPLIRREGTKGKARYLAV